MGIHRLLVLLVFVTACRGARQMQMAAVVTTTTTPAPAPDMHATRSASPLPLEPASPPPPACPESASAVSPLGRLRIAMKTAGATQLNTYFDAFLVFFSDEHLSDEPAKEERRLEYISGWDGAGTAAVLASGPAAIWVPSGDVRQARASLSCAWIVLDQDNPDHPTIADWVADRIGRSGRVGADARLTSVQEWQDLFTSLQAKSLTLVHVPTLVDQLWAVEPDPAIRRPEFSRIVATLYHRDYTGMSWSEKVQLLRREITANGADAMVVTALDEVAWLLNIRGRDLPYAPLLKAFIIVSLKEVKVYALAGKILMPIREALNVYNCQLNNCTRVLDYGNIYSDLRRAIESKIIIPSAGTFQRGASAAIAQSVPKTKQMNIISPIIYLKAQKNDAEIKGMKRAHLRDAVAMCMLLSYMEGMSKSGITEISVGTKVDISRATQAGYVGLSMATRVAFGPNGADSDYRPSKDSNRRVLNNSTLIIRSGGQYEEGTTMVTRTLHYGVPTREMRAAYTTVLRSLAAMATLQVPENLPATHADPVVRAPLWQARQDYPHPTGHGVGAALSRREDPVVIDYRQDTNLHTFREGYFITSEPAWYEHNKFGVRLGNVLEVVPRADGYLSFEEATLLPFEPKLIDRTMLTDYEMKWLNAYNDRIRKIVGPELQDQGLTDVYYWMTNKTIHVERPKPKGNGALRIGATWCLLVAMLLLHA